MKGYFLRIARRLGLVARFEAMHMGVGAGGVLVSPRLFVAAGAHPFRLEVVSCDESNLFRVAQYEARDAGPCVVGPDFSSVDEASAYLRELVRGLVGPTASRSRFWPFVAGAVAVFVLMSVFAAPLQSSSPTGTEASASASAPATKGQKMGSIGAASASTAESTQSKSPDAADPTQSMPAASMLGCAIQ